MRSVVGLFGALCGVIVVALVARYGFKTSDNPIDGAINAFLFGTIAVGGLGGHAVAIHIWRLNRAWAAVLGLVCASALVVNLTNSLGAIAGRSEHTQAERAKTKDTVADDRAELKRLTAQRDAVPPFVPTDADAVDGARDALKSAKEAREAECRDGRGKNCRAKEAEETAKADDLARVTAAKASTDQAAKLDRDIADIRARLDKAGPVQDVNPQGAALARLFWLSQGEADRASTYQQFAIAVIVELLIAGSFIAFEIMGKDRRAPPAPETIELDAATLRHEPPRIAAPEIQRPRLVASDATTAGSVPDIMADVLEPASTKRVEIEEAYRAYAAACEAQHKRAVKPEHFAELLQKFCAHCGIKTTRRGEYVYLVGVRIIDVLPDVKGERS